MSTATITIRGRRGQIVFFDDEDREQMEEFVGWLEDYPESGHRIRCAEIIYYEFTRTTVTLQLTLCEWSAERIAVFLCKCYDSYFRRKYKRDGKQTEYEIKRD